MCWRTSTPSSPETDTMKNPAPLRPAALAAAVCALTLLSISSAHADSGRAMPRNVPSAYTQECAACHTAYPPGLLPAASWNRVMTGLAQHYGTDASLDAATVRQPDRKSTRLNSSHMS